MKKVVRLLMLCILLGGCIWVARANVTVADSREVASVAEVSTEEASMKATAEEITTDEASEAEMSESSAEAVTEENTEDSVEEVKEDASVDVTEETTEEITSGDDAEKPLAKDFVVTLLGAPKMMYATIDLNVRSGPSTEYDVISHLKIAQEVKVTGQADTGWYQVFADGRAAYVSENYLSEEPVEVPQPAAVATTPAPAAPTAPATPTATVAPAGVIMVGDSRCVQMQAAVGGGGCSWICENSKEYTWFSETAIPKFDQYVGSGTKVVINMGVNDPEHYRQYAELVNAKAAEWAGRGARTYFVSVNPVWENPYTTQEQVDTFNANMPGLLSGVTWIDTSSWLNTNGYRLVDGLHFDDPTSVNIFNLIMGSL